MESQVDPADSREDGEGARGDAEPPPEANRQEGRDGESPRRVSAREGRIELRGATVAHERVHIRERIARSLSINEVLDRFRDDDRDGEKEEDVERGGPKSPQPQRNGHQEDHVDAAEDRGEDHDSVEDRIRAREVHGTEDEFVETWRRICDEGQMHAPG